MEAQMNHGSRLVLAVFFFAAACRPAPRNESTSMGGTADGNSAGLSAQDRSALEDLSKKWEQAATAGDANALSALYTSDATLLPENAPAVNGDGLKTFWTGFTKSFPGAKAELHTNSIEGQGDLAYATGTFRLTPKGASKAMEGKWVTVNKKQSDGSWKMLVDIWNENAPPAK
jgi:ketosteroid isomerase-like protein